jgi:hypothetical protein
VSLASRMVPSNEEAPGGRAPAELGVVGSGACDDEAFAVDAAPSCVPAAPWFLSTGLDDAILLDGSFDGGAVEEDDGSLGPVAVATASASSSSVHSITSCLFFCGLLFAKYHA